MFIEGVISMNCGICGGELDANGHCIPCERRAALNNLRRMTDEERLHYDGITFDMDGNEEQQRPNQSFKVYRVSGFTGSLLVYAVLIVLLLIGLFVVLPIAAAGIIIGGIIGLVLAFWRSLTRR